jgi:hypothetical protein
MHRFKLGSLEAKAMIQSLSSTGMGEVVDLSSPFPGFPGKAQAKVVENPKPNDWKVQLIALGIPVLLVNVWVDGNELCMEASK